MRSIAPRAATIAFATAAFWMLLGDLGYAAQETTLEGLSFSGYLAQGYRQTAAVALRNAPGLAAYFSGRGTLSAADRAPGPAQPDAARLSNWDFKEASFARTKLIASLDGGARARQPLLAAIAQVNFDCWVMPLPEQPGVPGGSECRRRFYFAFAGLAPPGPAPAGGEMLETVQVRSQTGQPKQLLIQIASAGGPDGASSAVDPDCTKNCLPLAFTGTDADRLIDALKRSGESGTAANGPSPDPAPGGPPAGGGDPAGAGGSSSGSGSDPAGAAGGALNAAGAAADSAVSGAGSAVSGAADGLGNAVGSAATGAGEAVSGAGDAVGGAVSGASNAVGGAVSGAGNAVGGTVSGAGGAVSKAADSVGGAVSGAAGGLGHALGGAAGGHSGSGL